MKVFDVNRPGVFVTEVLAYKNDLVDEVNCL